VFRKGLWFSLPDIQFKRIYLLQGKSWFVLCRKERRANGSHNAGNVGKLQEQDEQICKGFPWFLSKSLAKPSISIHPLFISELQLVHIFLLPCVSIILLSILPSWNLITFIILQLSYVRWDSNSINIYHVESTLYISNTANILLFQIDSEQSSQHTLESSLLRSIYLFFFN
jgi:hypothetical protein